MLKSCCFFLVLKTPNWVSFLSVPTPLLWRTLISLGTHCSLACAQILHQRELTESFRALNYTVFFYLYKFWSRTVKNISISHVLALAFIFLSANMNWVFPHICHLICKSLPFHPAQRSSSDIFFWVTMLNLIIYWWKEYDFSFILH